MPLFLETGVPGIELTCTAVTWPLLSLLLAWPRTIRGFAVATQLICHFVRCGQFVLDTGHLDPETLHRQGADSDP